MRKNVIQKIWLFIIVALLFIATGVIANAEENNEVCLEHNYIETVTPATLFEDGKITFKCDICGAEEVETISKVADVKISSTKVTYNGKVRTPSVIVTAEDDTELVKDVNYTVEYAEGRKLPGIYTISVSFIGKYEGEKKLKFTIAPKATTGVKAKEIAGTFLTLTWTKTTGATGYRVYQYSPSKGKYVLKESVKDTTYKVTGLKSTTSYKFKIKPYTKTKDGTVIWGNYSGVCTAKTTENYGVDISGTSATLYVGKTKQLKVTTKPANKTVTWESSKKSVATVSSTGKVTAKKEGKATITATFKYNGITYKDTYKITVKSTLSVNKTELTMEAGTTKKYPITITFKESGYVDFDFVYGTEFIGYEWGSWNDAGDKIDLYIYPWSYSYGESRIKIFSSNNPDKCIYVDITVTPSSKPMIYADKTSLTMQAGTTKKHPVTITYKGVGTVHCEEVTDNKLVTWEWGEWEDDYETITLYVYPRSYSDGQTRIKINSVDYPDEYVYVDIAVTPTTEATVFVDKPSLTIDADSNTKYSVLVTFRESGSVYYKIESGSDLISCEWSKEWNNNTTKLFITPKGNYSGEARIKIYAENNPEKCAYIIVNVVKQTVSAADNITKLINYIQAYGYTNSSYNKFIKKTYSDSGLTHSFAIVYDSSSDKLNFIYVATPDSGTGVHSTYSMWLNRSGTSFYGEMTFLYYDKYGDVAYGASSEDTISPSSYVNENSIFANWSFNSFPSSINLSQLLRSGTGAGMKIWDGMITNAIGVGFSGLGFSNYKS